MTLDERKKLILEAIIRDYVESAEPVGSRAMVRKHDLKISAATVRNEMADLEAMGYLEQPHTSAGRIPSEKGFRYYVDCMMEKELPDDEEVEMLHQVISGNRDDWNNLIQSIARFIAQVTNYAAFVIVPSVKVSQFQYMQIVPLQNNQALMLLVTDVGIIMHRKISISPSVTPDDLQIISDAFTQVFKGKNILEMGRNELQSIKDKMARRQKMMDMVLEALHAVLEGSNEDRVVISGALNILNEPEFKDTDKLRKILSILAQDGSLKEVIPEQVPDDVNIRIGKENNLQDIKEMSLVYAGYRMSGDMGKIGLIGPIRMEYWKAAGTVESVKDMIEKIIRERF
ncbi:MAG TPA: heat-inducible transcriptional repressor HrcA [Syntrophomonadaceae bacterium]|nr:heat-inducible transcriptional repressor HrcA [Syntrophomonadaceae bacterium]